jgi:hypothetical protein
MYLITPPKILTYLLIWNLLLQVAGRLVRAGEEDDFVEVKCWCKRIVIKKGCAS